MQRDEEVGIPADLPVTIRRIGTDDGVHSVQVLPGEAFATAAVSCKFDCIEEYIKYKKNKQKISESLQSRSDHTN